MEQGFNNEDNFINSQQRAYIEHLAQQIREGKISNVNQDINNPDNQLSGLPWGCYFGPDDIHQQLDALHIGSLEGNIRQHYGRGEGGRLWEDQVPPHRSRHMREKANPLEKLLDPFVLNDYENHQVMEQAVEDKKQEPQKPNEKNTYYDTVGILKRLTQNQYLMDWTDARETKKLSGMIAEHHY